MILIIMVNEVMLRVSMDTSPRPQTRKELTNGVTDRTE